MSLNRFAVADENHGDFGRLVKDWSRGNAAIPKTVEEFRQQLLDREIVVKWPVGIHEVKHIDITQTDPHTLHFKIPPVSFLDESEAYIIANNYPLPSYYSTLFGGASWDADNVDGPLALHDLRTGDYTVANCA